MKLILMGTGPFAVPSFEAIRRSETHGIVKVITRPDRTDGKGKGVENPVRSWAESHGLSLEAPNSINEPSTIAALRELDAELSVVCDYGQILSAEAIAATKWGGINLHGSLLPRHRGAAPVQWSILRGDAVTGVSVIHLTPRLDGGPILASATTPIDPRENAAELELRLSQLGVDCCLEALAKLGQVARLDDLVSLGKPQDPSQVTKAPRLTKGDGSLDFRQSSRLIDRQVRGLQPWPGAFGNLLIGEQTTLRAAVIEGTPYEHPSQVFEPGTLIWGEMPFSGGATASGGEVGSPPVLVVACGQGFYAIATLQPAGKKRMKAKEFLAGYGRSGQLRFELPPALTQNSLYQRMVGE